MTEPLLLAYEQGLAIMADLDAQLLAAARADGVCRLLMTVPGVGAMTALAFRTGVDIASRFEKSQTVGAIWPHTTNIFVRRSRTRRTHHQMRRRHGPLAAL